MSIGQIIVLAFFLCLILGWGIWRAYRYMTRVTRRLRLLLESLDAGDTSLRFPETPDAKVNGTLNRITERLSEMKRIAVENDRFHEAVLTDIATGVMVYDTRGYVITHNPALLNLLSRPALANIESLRSSDETLADFLINAKAGSSVQLGRFSIKVTVFNRHNGEQLRIATFDDISSQLEGKSVEAWMDMSRVLTHEIMNGIAPVLSVADSLRMRYKGDEEYIFTGLRAISESCEGLKNFVARYNCVTRVPKPEPELFDIFPLLDDCISLVSNMEGLTKPEHVSCCVQPGGVPVYADKGQIQQVMINLIKNAFETDATEVKVICSRSKSGYTTVTVKDNGTPIPPEISERIFTPFFTTKSTGSGIGLSLSRRMVIENHGSLTLATKGNETRFVLALPASEFAFNLRVDKKI